MISDGTEPKVISKFLSEPVAGDEDVEMVDEQEK